MSGQPATPVIGASGSAMAMAGMYAVFCPQHRIRMVAWLRLFVLARIIHLPGFEWQETLEDG